MGGAARSRACIPISHTTRRVHSLCGSLLPLPCARITGVSYAATRANEFREASLCCALCVQRAPHIGQTLHSSAVGWRVMELAPARTFTYKFAAACGTVWDATQNSGSGSPGNNTQSINEWQCC